MPKASPYDKGDDPRGAAPEMELFARFGTAEGRLR